MLSLFLLNAAKNFQPPSSIPHSPCEKQNKTFLLSFIMYIFCYNHYTSICLFYLSTDIHIWIRWISCLYMYEGVCIDVSYICFCIPLTLYCLMLVFLFSRYYFEKEKNEMPIKILKNKLKLKVELKLPPKNTNKKNTYWLKYDQ